MSDREFFGLKRAEGELWTKFMMRVVRARGIEVPPTKVSSDDGLAVNIFSGGYLLGLDLYMRSIDPFTYRELDQVNHTSLQEYVRVHGSSRSIWLNFECIEEDGSGNVYSVGRITEEEGDLLGYEYSDIIAHRDGENSNWFEVEELVDKVLEWFVPGRLNYLVVCDEEYRGGIEGALKSDEGCLTQFDPADQSYYPNWVFGSNHAVSCPKGRDVEIDKERLQEDIESAKSEGVIGMSVVYIGRSETNFQGLDAVPILCNAGIPVVCTYDCPDSGHNRALLKARFENISLHQIDHTHRAKRLIETAEKNMTFQLPSVGIVNAIKQVYQEANAFPFCNNP